jgi:hypothetical protein
METIGSTLLDRLNVILDFADRSAAMMRLAHRFAKRVAAREL